MKARKTFGNRFEPVVGRRVYRQECEPNGVTVAVPTHVGERNDTVGIKAASPVFIRPVQRRIRRLRDHGVQSEQRNLAGKGMVHIPADLDVAGDKVLQLVMRAGNGQDVVKVIRHLFSLLLFDFRNTKSHPARAIPNVAQSQGGFLRCKKQKTQFDRYFRDSKLDLLYSMYLT